MKVIVSFTLYVTTLYHNSEMILRINYPTSELGEDILINLKETIAIPPLIATLINEGMWVQGFIFC